MKHFYYKTSDNGIAENHHLYMDSDYFLDFYSEMLKRGSTIQPITEQDFNNGQLNKEVIKVPLEATGTQLPGFIEHYEI